MWCGRWPIRLASRDAILRCKILPLACPSLAFFGSWAECIIKQPRSYSCRPNQEWLPREGFMLQSLASVGAPPSWRFSDGGQTTSAWTWTRQLVFKLYATCCYPQLVSTVQHIRRDSEGGLWPRTGTVDRAQRWLSEYSFPTCYLFMLTRVLWQNTALCLFASVPPSEQASNICLAASWLHILSYNQRRSGSL